VTITEYGGPGVATATHFQLVAVALPLSARTLARALAASGWVTVRPGAGRGDMTGALLNEPKSILRREVTFKLAAQWHWPATPAGATAGVTVTSRPPAAPAIRVRVTQFDWHCDLTSG
jgi:hypothetical protein